MSYEKQIPQPLAMYLDMIGVQEVKPKAEPKPDLRNHVAWKPEFEGQEPPF